MLKIIPTVAAVASASALTNATMGMGIVPFLTEGWLAKSNLNKSSAMISLSELFTDGFGLNPSKHTAIGDVVMENVKRHGGQAIAVMIGAKAIPKLLTKTGVPRTFNRLLKDSGLGSIVQL